MQQLVLLKNLKSIVVIYVKNQWRSTREHSLTFFIPIQTMDGIAKSVPVFVLRVAVFHLSMKPGALVIIQRTERTYI